MEAIEVKQLMDSLLEKKDDYDEYTSQAYAKGIFGMKFGASLVVEGMCKFYKSKINLLQVKNTLISCQMILL